MDSMKSRGVEESRNYAASRMPNVTLNDDQIAYAMQCVAQWIDIYQQNMEKPSDRMLSPNAIRPTPPDATHSALLRRLLKGKNPFVNPPPIRFAYPSYDLAEGKECYIGEIGIYNPLPNCSPENLAEFQERTQGYTVVVDQHMGWKWIEKQGEKDGRGVPESGILEYKDGTRYRFWHGLKTFKRLNRLSPKKFEDFQERVKLMQLIKEEDDARTD